MALTTTVRARIDQNLKNDAQVILQEIGISTSQAINLFFKRLVIEKDIPFKTKVPTARLQAAFEQIDKGETVSYSGVEEMMKDLNS